MSKAENITLSIAIALVLITAFVVAGWINSPTDLTININMDNNTKDAVLKVAELQQEVARLELDKLNLEINNSLNQNITYGENVSCMVGFYNQEYNESSDSWYDIEEVQFYESDLCYVIK